MWWVLLVLLLLLLLLLLLMLPSIAKNACPRFFIVSHLLIMRNGRWVNVVRSGSLLLVGPRKLLSRPQLFNQRFSRPSMCAAFFRWKHLRLITRQPEVFPAIVKQIVNRGFHSVHGAVSAFFSHFFFLVVF